jgi:hypothetical protein
MHQGNPDARVYTRSANLRPIEGEEETLATYLTA